MLSGKSQLICNLSNLYRDQITITKNQLTLTENCQERRDTPQERKKERKKEKKRNRIRSCAQTQGHPIVHLARVGSERSKIRRLVCPISTAYLILQWSDSLEPPTTSPWSSGSVLALQTPWLEMLREHDNINYSEVHAGNRETVVHFQSPPYSRADLHS